MGVSKCCQCQQINIQARIPEYWIVNPLDETITVLTLAGDAYAEHGVFRRGETATSALLDGFAAPVDAVFDAPQAS
jgi:Uma2 family endonuclease